LWNNRIDRAIREAMAAVDRVKENPMPMPWPTATEYLRNVSMFACPYCLATTDVPGAADFWMVEAASAVCEHCGKEFIIVENFPLTAEQYRAARPSGRPLVAKRYPRLSPRTSQSAGPSES
jgi:hypothetical protein